MIKRNQKLTLHRETLQPLVRATDLRQVHGGIVSTDNRVACHTKLSGPERLETSAA